MRFEIPEPFPPCGSVELDETQARDEIPAGGAGRKPGRALDERVELVAGDAHLTGALDLLERDVLEAEPCRVLCRDLHPVEAAIVEIEAHGDAESRELPDGVARDADDAD